MSNIQMEDITILLKNEYNQGKTNPEWLHVLWYGSGYVFLSSLAKGGQKKSIRYIVTGVIVACELPEMGAENWILVICYHSCTLNHYSISSAPTTSILLLIPWVIYQ